MCSAPSSAASSSTTNTMMDTTLLSSVSQPTARPPAALSFPVRPPPNSYAVRHSARWHSTPISSGSTATHTVRRITGRPLCPSWITATAASAGAVR